MESRAPPDVRLFPSFAGGSPADLGVLPERGASIVLAVDRIAGRPRDALEPPTRVDQPVGGAPGSGPVAIGMPDRLQSLYEPS